MRENKFRGRVLGKYVVEAFFKHPSVDYEHYYAGCRQNHMKPLFKHPSDTLLCGKYQIGRGHFYAQAPVDVVFIARGLRETTPVTPPAHDNRNAEVCVCVSVC